MAGVCLYATLRTQTVTKLPAAASDPERRKRIPEKVKRAIDALIEGRARNISAAADLVECSRAYISRELGKPHIADYFKNRVAKAVALTGGRAAARLAELIDDERSAHVALDASKFVLGTLGIKPTADPAVNVNLNVPAGWIIDLTPPKEIELEALPPSPADGE